VGLQACAKAFSQFYTTTALTRRAAEPKLFNRYVGSRIGTLEESLRA
jgi:hypothetical protein